MKILRLRLQNYRRHRDVELEFPDGVIAIVGRNGSGKTSLLEAIAFALYGTQATRTAKALLRSDDAPPGDPLRVEVDAELAGQAMTISRELRGSQQTGVATLIVDGHTIVAPQAGSFEAVTAEVTARLGLDRDTFFTTVFAPQKDLARLADKSKAERKKMILGMMGIDALDRAIQEARTLRRTSETAVQTLQAQVARFTDAEAAQDAANKAVVEAEKAVALSQKRWSRAQTALAAATQEHALLAKLEAEHARLLHALQEARLQAAHAQQRAEALEARLLQAAQARSEMAQHEPMAARLPALRTEHEAAVRSAQDHQRRQQLVTRLQALQADVAALHVPTAPNGMLAKLEMQVATATSTHASHREAFAVATAQGRAIKDRLRRIASIGEDACPVCERPMDGAELRRHLEAEWVQREAAIQQASQQVAQAEAVLHQVQAARAEASAAQRRHEQALARRDELRRAIALVEQDLAAIPDAPRIGPATLLPALQEAEAAHASLLGLQALANALPTLTTERDAARDEAAAQHEGLEGAQQAVNDIAHDPAALQAAAAALAAATRDERDAERQVTQANQAAALAEAHAKQAALRQREAGQVRTELADATKQHRLYEALAGGRGAGLFERFRNHLVGRIGPAVAAEASHLLARFTNGRYTEVLLDDEYDIYVTDEGVRYQLDRFSGGESDLVHLALRLAISRLLLERSGAEIRFLALDEVFGSLDDERRRLVLGALQELGTLYSQVFLVTHHEDMREMLDHALLVEEGASGAVVRMHNV